MSETGSNPNLKRALTIGCSLLTFISLACLISFAAIFRSEIPVVKNYFPTFTPTRMLTPTSTPVPHILVHSPTDHSLVLKDDFTTNHNEWSIYYSLGKVEVKDGKLILESFDSGIEIAHCFCKLPSEQLFADTYYLQADLSTENLTSESYGIIFGLAENGDFYEFSINPRKRKFYLQKGVGDGWIDLVSGSNQIIKAYPEVNTLSIYFDRGTIELFINGEKIKTYIDKDPINEGQIGFIADESNFKLIIDNLFAYNQN